MALYSKDDPPRRQTKAQSREGQLMPWGAVDPRRQGSCHMTGWIHASMQDTENADTFLSSFVVYGMGITIVAAHSFTNIFVFRSETGVLRNNIDFGMNPFRINLGLIFAKEFDTERINFSEVLLRSSGN
jgi:hypothetical protein